MDPLTVDHRASAVTFYFDDLPNSLVVDLLSPGGQSLHVVSMQALTEKGCDPLYCGEKAMRIVTAHARHWLTRHGKAF